MALIDGYLLILVRKHTGLQAIGRTSDPASLGTPPTIKFVTDAIYTPQSDTVTKTEITLGGSQIPVIQTKDGQVSMSKP